jgi:hypothetical protein
MIWPDAINARPVAAITTYALQALRDLSRSDQLLSTQLPVACSPTRDVDANDRPIKKLVPTLSLPTSVQRQLDGNALPEALHSGSGSLARPPAVFDGLQAGRQNGQGLVNIGGRGPGGKQ